MDEIYFATVRVAQRSWAAKPLKNRLQVFRVARQLMADNAHQFAGAVMLGDRRTSGETLTLELIPLLDAIRFLERSAGRVLALRRAGRAGRPVWLAGVRAEVRREALGTILIIAPFNYPLFLPGVQVIQALVAGNAVIVKPSPGHSAAMVLLRDMLFAAGLPRELLTVTDDTVAAANRAIALQPDKIILTGSAQTGRAVLAQASAHLIPTVMELSGNDAVIILPGADMDYTVQSLAWALCLNGGATCIAPRRVFVFQELLVDLRDRLSDRLADSPEHYIGAPATALVGGILNHARETGSEVIGGTMSHDKSSMKPAIVVNPCSDSRLLYDDIFAPILSLISVTNQEEALKKIADCDYRLGAAVFGPLKDAERLADQLDVGFVTVNDLIVSTADPRLPFGGHGESGFGATRGPEGLLEMTRAKSVIVRNNRSTLHFIRIGQKETEFFLGFIALIHGRRTFRSFTSVLLRLARALLKWIT